MRFITYFLCTLPAFSAGRQHFLVRPAEFPHQAQSGHSLAHDGAPARLGIARGAEEREGAVAGRREAGAVMRVPG